MPDAPKKPGPRILIVDDEPVVLTTMSRFLSSRGCRITCAYTGAEALKRVIESTFDAVLVDNDLPDRMGLTLIPEIALRSNAVIFMMTGHSTAEEEIDARLLGAKRFFLKPIDLPNLADALLSEIRMRQG